MKRALSIGCALVLSAIIVSLGFSASAAVGAKKTESTKAKSAGKLRGADPNIKRSGNTNHAGSTEGAVAPKGKAGAKSRGSYATVHIDNRTPWIIHYYDNGNEMGVVGRYGDAYYAAVPGGHSLYAVAYFDDGTRKTWGPLSVDLDDGDVENWHLTL